MKRFASIPGMIVCVLLGFLGLGTGCSDHHGRIHEDRTVYVEHDRGPYVVDRHVYHDHHHGHHDWDDDDHEIEIDD